MAKKFFSKQDLRFQLYEVLNAEQLCQYPYYKDHSAETFDMVLDAAEGISESLLKPLLTEMDRKEPQLIDGRIRIHPSMKPIIKKFGNDGWINATFSYDEGGQQLPIMVHNAAAFIFQAANYSASVFPFLTTGAANLLRSFGSETLKNAFTPKMYLGEWQGTMALTEPNAGSSLSDISTSATPTDTEGVYQIEGQKIFISAGDHDLADNHVHLLLARIKGSVVGTKGISLFAVPRKRPDNIENPNDWVENDVLTAGVYHKMGYKGCPIAHLMFGSNKDCYGYLVGEANKGLSYMFQMMNEARIGVGTNAVAIGTAAYYASLEYALERPQGRHIAEKNPLNPPVSIIKHADVKRMLLFQKAVTEGALSLLMYCGYLSDLTHVSSEDEQERAALLLDLLTPIAKSYPSEMCCQTTSAAVQILGGAGYTTDFPVEQFYREARIHPIHEGTTGIHGLDLLGRKITIKNGLAVQYLGQEIMQAIKTGETLPELKHLAQSLTKNLGRFQTVSGHLLAKAADDVEGFLADATLYLEMMGIVVIAWQWLKQANIAQQKLYEDANNDFYRGKVMAARYFFEYELVKVSALAKRLESPDKVTIEMQAAWF